MGFAEVVSPMVESAFWNFDALFQPQDHPAREMQDTFYMRHPATAPLPGEASRTSRQKSAPQPALRAPSTTSASRTKTAGKPAAKAGATPGAPNALARSSSARTPPPPRSAHWPPTQTRPANSSASVGPTATKRSASNTCPSSIRSTASSSTKKPTSRR